MKSNWFDINYMGKKQKRYFKFLDTLLIKLFKEAKKQDGKLDPDLFDQIIKLTGRQTTISAGITKMYNDVIAESRVRDIEFLLDNVPSEALREAAKHPRWANRNWSNRDMR